MDNTDCDKAKEAQAKEKLASAIQTVIKGLLDRGLSAEQVRDWLKQNLNEADNDGEWDITITRVH